MRYDLSTFGLVAVSAFVVAMCTRASGLKNMHICTVRLYSVQLITAKFLHRMDIYFGIITQDQGMFGFSHRVFF